MGYHLSLAEPSRGGAPWSGSAFLVTLESIIQVLQPEPLAALRAAFCSVLSGCVGVGGAVSCKGMCGRRGREGGLESICPACSEHMHSWRKLKLEKAATFPAIQS
jgi:hypothetical protein